MQFSQNHYLEKSKQAKAVSWPDNEEPEQEGGVERMLRSNLKYYGVYEEGGRWKFQMGEGPQKP